jgi:hypothetical protein
MITRVSSVIRPKGSDLIFDHPYNADSARLRGPLNPDDDRAQMDQIRAFVLG